MIKPYEEIVSLIEPRHRVLDVGGWAEVFPRANVVLDMNPYQTRRVPYENETEHFSKDDWVVGDVCSFDVWQNFRDKEFDFAVCAHTLEDLRDPLFVCSQLIRVAKAGYIEVPSPLRETSKMDPHAKYAGYDHHRWIVDVDEEGRLVFVPKLSWANDFDYGGDRARKRLQDSRFQILSIKWKNRFAYYERIPKGSVLESENLFLFHENYDYANATHEFVLSELPPPTPTSIWADDYLLPIEERFSHEFLIKRYKSRSRSSSLRSSAGRLAARLLPRRAF